MNLQKYKTEDFLEDKSFIDYVLFNSTEEGDLWDNFQANYPEKIKEFETAKSILLGLKSKEREFSENDLEELLVDLKGRQSASKSIQISSTNQNGWFGIQKIAASIVFILLAGVSYWYFSLPVEQIQETTIAIIEKINPKGQNSTIKLKDGSVVRLNAESILRIPEQFKSDLREVELIGEAFFEVAKDSSRPFIIKTGNIKTKVLGTSFNIKSYPEDENVKIAVVTGKVMVGNLDSLETGEEVLLIPNQMATYHKSTRLFEKGSFNPDDVIAWKKGVIYFHEAGFEEIKEVLERWYGVEFRVKKQVDFGQGFTGRFEKESLETVLKGLSYAADFDFSIEKDIVLIK
ncbi:FecR family protein [Flexithrix dorotheae]|uniref:FecR family protein n=1 Tax=Flexithrix dorotheae TaxID=70993 RepID=UPI0003658FA2|nr:FecR family protein [Flexithrix dorotheae]